MPERRDAFWYTTVPAWSAAMAAVGGIAAATINIDKDAEFVALRMVGKVRQGAAGAEVLVTTWAGNILIVMAGRGFVSDIAIGIPFDEFVTPGSPPYELSPPITFPAGATIQITYTSNVVTRTQCQLTLHGFKYYAG